LDQFLIGKQLSNLKDLLYQGIIKPIYSKQLLDELIQVTQRPKLQKYFPRHKVEELIIFLREIGEVIEIKSTVSICRDPKDNYLLALAKDSQANFLITGDQDLLVIKKFEKTNIVNYQEFLLSINFDQ
jgi:putative PIN family toxin of toxin-antitoxin system